jgi:hypothetical protein
MANSYVEYTTGGTGTNQLGQTTFTVPTNFININDINAKGFNGSVWTALTISSRATNTITLSATPTAGSYSKLRVYRQTSTAPLVDFVDGARLTESDLDAAYRQGLYAAQEVSEDAGAIGNVIPNNPTLNGTTTTTNLTATGLVTTANLTATGTVTIPSSTNLSVTNLTTTGIVQIPSGTDSNHFYREGNYTAAMTCATSGTITLKTDSNYNTGYYIKIGKLVTVSGDIRVASVSSPTGAIALSLPFAVASTSRYVSSIITHGVAKQTNQLGAYFLQAVGGTSTANISYNKDNSTNASLSGTIAADNEFKFTLTYTTT